MGKIKNLTPEQRKTHDLAVKLRKLPDDQLVERLATQRGIARNAIPQNNVENFLQALEAENLRGVGKITIEKIGEFAKQKGYI